MPPRSPGASVELAMAAGMPRVPFSEMIRRGAGEFGVDLDEAAVERLYRYYLELKHWSARINLISREARDEDIVEKHFIDSLALVPLLGADHECLLDIGSGAGFPGLACKIARPDMAGCLLEPRLKRVSFLRQVIRLLGLSGIDVQSSRLEEGQVLPGEERYRTVVGRAVSDIGEFLRMCRRFRRSECRVICMKGPGFRQELEAAGDELDGWTMAEPLLYRLPFSNAARALLVFRGGVTGGER